MKWITCNSVNLQPHDTGAIKRPGAQDHTPAAKPAEPLQFVFVFLREWHTWFPSHPQTWPDVHHLVKWLCGPPITHLSPVWWCTPRWQQGHSLRWCRSAGRTCICSRAPGHAEPTWWCQGCWYLLTAEVPLHPCHWLQIYTERKKCSCLQRESLDMFHFGFLSFKEDVSFCTLWKQKKSPINPFIFDVITPLEKKIAARSTKLCLARLPLVLFSWHLLFNFSVKCFHHKHQSRTQRGDIRVRSNKTKHSRCWGDLCCDRSALPLWQETTETMTAMLYASPSAWTKHLVGLIKLFQ